MDERTIAIENEILRVRSGSHLYGTNTEKSDEDFISIFIPTEDYLLGLNNIEQVDLGTEDKNELGKNTEDAIDCISYTLEKFVRLALQNNPNILELLFVNKANIIRINSIGEELLSLTNDFLSEESIRKRFIGYAHAQKSKMIIKTGNYEEIVAAIQLLEDSQVKWLNDLPVIAPLVRVKDYIKVGDIRFQANLTKKSALKILRDRATHFGWRTELIKKFGYETKFASHLIRLLIECIELLETGTLSFPLKNRYLLLEIKEGRYSLEETLQRATNLEDYIRALDHHKLKGKKSDFHKVNNFLIETHWNSICYC
uniref:Putative nucleotidyltransferase n=1 Tax=viral metagenome TaxID=1070528 RepID=A0A6M3KME8_9ZZZZ